MNEALTRLVNLLRTQEAERLRGRKLVVFAPVLASATPRVEHYRTLGVTEQLIVTFGDGTGLLPSGDDLTVVRATYEAPVLSVMDELAGWRHVLNNPPTHVLAAVDSFDPEGTALVLNATPTASDAKVFGRDVIGGRSLADESLEDKTLCGAIFEAAGLRTPPEEVVSADSKSLRDSVLRLDRGAGVVISADASQGMNGGAAKVWWVRPGTDPSTVFREVAAAGERARVMPFLEGQPCSIHGIVTDRGVLVLRPVELCMLRPAGGHRFVQAGISTWWDPTSAQRDEMRTAARRVGEALAGEHRYRGAFGIDGILTADGFRPHELNPRFSGGINTINKGTADVPLNLLDQTVRSGANLDVELDAVETELLDAADANRAGSAYLATDAVTPQATTAMFVCGTPDDLRPCDDDATAVGTLELGPAAMGALVRFTPIDFAHGERMTPWAAAALDLADRLWHTGFGPMEQPREVR